MTEETEVVTVDTKIEDGNTPRKKNDIIFKGVFEDYFVHLLRFTYANADQIFDFSKKIDFMNQELAEINIDPDRAGGTTRADLLAKVFLMDGTEQCFYLHIEIQAETNAAFSERVFAYYIRLRDKYGPSVVSLAVYTGKKSQLRPNLYQSSVLGTELNFKFHTYQIFDHTEDELLAMNNPFALAVIVAQQEALSKKLKDADRQTTRIKIMKALKANSKLSPVQIREFILFLNRIIIVEDSKYNIIFDQEVQAITGGAITMGITETLKMLDREEGIEIGIERGIEQERAHKNFEFVARLLEKAGWSDEQTADVANVSVAYVNEVRNELASRK